MKWRANAMGHGRMFYAGQQIHQWYSRVMARQFTQEPHGPGREDGRDLAEGWRTRIKSSNGVALWEYPFPQKRCMLGKRQTVYEWAGTCWGNSSRPGLSCLSQHIYMTTAVLGGNLRVNEATHVVQSDMSPNIILCIQRLFCWAQVISMRIMKPGAT